jgi:uncharacterized membrane protein
MKHNIPNQSRKGTITPHQITVSEYSGLMPHPDNLAKFEQIQPGFADRMLRMAEGEIQNKQLIDRQIVKGSFQGTILGIVAALVSVVCICGLSFYALHLGYATQAATIMIGSAAAIVSAFLLRKKANQKNVEKE